MVVLGVRRYGGTRGSAFSYDRGTPALLFVGLVSRLAAVRQAGGTVAQAGGTVL